MLISASRGHYYGLDAYESLLKWVPDKVAACAGYACAVTFLIKVR